MIDQPTATTKRRECGWRTVGGVYLVSPRSVVGHPIEEYLIDPPVMLPDPSAMGITALGVTLIMDPETGITNVWDWVGGDYPTVARYVEEARHLGVSRHVAKGLRWDRLDRRSQLILVHPRAIIGHSWDYFGAELAEISTQRIFEKNLNAGLVKPYICTQIAGEKHCNRKASSNHHAVDEPPAMCSRLWWQDEDPRQGVEIKGRLRRYTLACGATYDALQQPVLGEGRERRYMPGVFARFPIAIEVIRDRDGDNTSTIERILRNTDLQVREVDE